jgi:hypothetical protein
MPDKEKKTIPVFEAVEFVSTGVEGTTAYRPIYARGAKEKVINMVETGVDVLRDNMSSFIETVGDMISSSAEAAGNYEIDTVEVECQLSGNGKVGFAGTGIGLTGGSGLKIIFKKKKS